LTCADQVERQGSRALDLLHRERRRHTRQVGDPDQAFVEPVIPVDIGRDHFQQVVHITAHAVKLKHFR